MTFADLHFLGSKLRRSALMRQWAIWRLIDPAWHRVCAHRHIRGLVTYINGERFVLEARFGSPYGRHDPRDYEEPFYRAVMQAIEAGMQVLDIGADIGLFTLGAARRVEEGKVFAFEANQERAEIVRRHVALNGLAERVEVVDLAVWDRVGQAAFYVSRELPMTASLARANAEFLSPSRARGLSVRCTTLDAFVARTGATPQVIKIDAEGAELAILRGGRHLLRTASPTIFCEVHPREMLNCGASLEEFEAFVCEAGYTMERLTEPFMGGIFHARLTRTSITERYA